MIETGIPRKFKTLRQQMLLMRKAKPSEPTSRPLVHPGPELSKDSAGIVADDHLDAAISGAK